MISVSPLWIISLSLFVISFMVMMLFIILSFRKTKSEPLSLTSHLPCEIVEKAESNKFLLNVLNYLFAGLPILNIILVVMNKDAFGGLFYLVVLIASLILLTTLSSITLFTIPIFYVKQHIVISTLFMSLAFFVSALISFFGIYISYLARNQSIGSPIHLVLGIVSGVFSLIELLLIFNPKLKGWANLDKITSGDEVSYARPRFFPLAYTEWLSLLITFLVGVIFLLSLLIY